MKDLYTIRKDNLKAIRDFVVEEANRAGESYKDDERLYDLIAKCVEEWPVGRATDIYGKPFVERAQ